GCRRLRWTRRGHAKEPARLESERVSTSPCGPTTMSAGKHEELPIRRRRLAASSVWLALTVCILDSSIVNVALPTITRELGVEPGDAVAVVSAFQLGTVVALLPMSALGEIVTYRRVFLGGLALFTIASLGCALSNNLMWLV